MLETPNGSIISTCTRSLSKMAEIDAIRVGVDLVSAARTNINFLRTVAESHWLHQTPTVTTYPLGIKTWMPLVADLTQPGSKPPMIVPPIDIEWVWFCHALNPASDKEYCETKFSKIISKPAKRMKKPHKSEVVYLIAARQRYKAFLYMLQRLSDESSDPLIPASDITLMWLTHQSYPTIYMEDLKELALENNVKKVTTLWETPKEKDLEETKKLWDRLFNQPYEKAGGEVVLILERFIPVESPVHYWEESDTNVNKKYSFLLDSWQKAWHLYCKFGSRGLIIEYRRRGGNCLKGSSLQDSVTFHWNDLLRAHSLTLEKEICQHVSLVVSITPLVEAPNLLKCVPDRVTDDSGEMISDVFLKMNGYHPQQGRWLSRTVLDHAREGEEVLGGGEAPSAVKWADRIVEIREESCSYVAVSIEKIVATATPKEPVEPCKAAWSFSTGDELVIQRESSLSMSGLSFCLRSQTSPQSLVKLLKRRQMQYQVKKSKCRSEEIQNKVEEKEIEEEEDEEDFLTVVRFTEENPTGKATALVNWKLLVIELLPEEDAVLMLLLCISILRSVSESKAWELCYIPLRYLHPWYWNAGVVMTSDPANQVTRQPALNHSPVEGSDKLYKLGIIS
ncbi:hypothetical protein L6164_034990 [Bauhinia variegata]|uniref:Uncharacterized protein n=1 Tax=Bauhinia variegata TaxID=167791 RepID=A0ACB9KWS8_BAUVA|nr:hypothetical protein L6164_034990 [Bauhinia variegata]